jgi:hypothetical protein
MPVWPSTSEPLLLATNCAITVTKRKMWQELRYNLVTDVHGDCNVAMHVNKIEMHNLGFWR